MPVVRERRRNATYYAGDLRRDLLDAALQVVATEGPSAVNLRALARDIGVSHAAPANHFPDKTAVFTAIAQEGFELLGQAMAAAADAVPAAVGPTPRGSTPWGRRIWSSRSTIARTSR